MVTVKEISAIPRVALHPDRARHSAGADRADAWKRITAAQPRQIIAVS